MKSNSRPFRALVVVVVVADVAPYNCRAIRVLNGRQLSRRSNIA